MFRGLEEGDKKMNKMAFGLNFAIHFFVDRFVKNIHHYDKQRKIRNVGESHKNDAG